MFIGDIGGPPVGISDGVEGQVAIEGMPADEGFVGGGFVDLLGGEVFAGIFMVQESVDDGILALGGAGDHRWDAGSFTAVIEAQEAFIDAGEYGTVGYGSGDGGGGIAEFVINFEGDAGVGIELDGGVGASGVSIIEISLSGEKSGFLHGVFVISPDGNDGSAE